MHISVWGEYTLNEKDMKLSEMIMDELDDMGDHRVALFNTNFTQKAKTNLLLLKGFMDIKGKKGLFVNLDRPHQYISYLLNMHDVNQENLWYIDTITNMSGQEKKQSDNVSFIDDPFHIEELFEKFDSEVKTGLKDEFGFIENVDFILIDNISTMLDYNKIVKVDEFIRIFYDFIEEHPNLIGGMTIDSDSNPELNELVNGYFEFSIDVEELQKEV